MCALFEILCVVQEEKFSFFDGKIPSEKYFCVREKELKKLIGGSERTVGF